MEVKGFKVFNPDWTCRGFKFEVGQTYEIVATLDNDTSEICQEMDGKHFPMKDYEAGVTAPPFHPWCRSVTVPWFEDNFTSERAARDAEGKTYYVPDNMKYADWKKSMVDGQTKDKEGKQVHRVSGCYCSAGYSLQIVVQNSEQCKPN